MEVVVLEAAGSVSSTSSDSVASGSGGASVDGAAVVWPGRFLAISGFTLRTWTVALAAAFGLEAMLTRFLFLKRAKGLLSTGAGVSS